MELTDFIQHFTLNAPQFMWFLGAGAPRSAGLPTAYNLIWDLKKKYYARQENIDIAELDITNEFVRKKIQHYMDSRGFPREDSAEEYSFYFEKSFGTDYNAQRQYLDQKLIAPEFKPNVGYNVLSALLFMKRSHIVFTTNFDNLLEKAYSHINSSVLDTYNLEGSEAAVNALTNSSFPFYVKLHGDFRYKSIKNLEKDLKNNDEELERCFITAASRFGVIVSGYSGRDNNVMNMFNKALDTTNPFPRGLFWTTSSKNNCLPSVIQLIEKAKSKGVQADIIEVNTFDDLLSRIWNQIEDKPAELAGKINVKKRSFQEQLNTSVEEGVFPVIRLNAFPIIQFPSQCLKIISNEFKTLSDLKDKIKEVKTGAIFTKTSDILVWGSESDIKKVIPQISQIQIENLTLDIITSNTVLHNFIYRALVYALCNNRPLSLRKRKNSFYLVVNPALDKLKLLSCLENVTEKLNGEFNSIKWAECVEVNLEYKNDQCWLTMSPDIWIDPADRRSEMSTFIVNKKKRRYNTIYNKLIDCWKNILFGEQNIPVTFSSYNFDDNVANPHFIISPITAFSRRLK